MKKLLLLVTIFQPYYCYYFYKGNDKSLFNKTVESRLDIESISFQSFWIIFNNAFNDAMSM